MISFGSRNITNTNFILKMGTSTLEKVEFIKYLGVMLDHKLSWSWHVEYLRKKLASATGMLSNIKYYVDVQTLMKIYHALFKSKLQYAFFSWGSANIIVLQPLSGSCNLSCCSCIKVYTYELIVA